MTAPVATNNRVRRRGAAPRSVSSTAAFGLPTLRPGVELRSERIDRPRLVVHVAVHGHPLALFPALNSRDVTAQISRDLFPGFQPVGQKAFAHGGRDSRPRLWRAQRTAFRGTTPRRRRFRTLRVAGHPDITDRAGRLPSEPLSTGGRDASEAHVECHAQRGGRRGRVRRERPWRRRNPDSRPRRSPSGRFGDIDAASHVLRAFGDATPRKDLWLSLQKTKGPSDLYVQSNALDPERQHRLAQRTPGHSLIIVTAGTVTAYEGDDTSCTATEYSVGMGFVDHGGDHAHLLRNEGAVDAKTVAVQLIPAGATRRIDAAKPDGCSVF